MARKVKIEDESVYYNDIKRLLDESLKDMSRENLFAVYGYINAFYEMGNLSDAHFDELLNRLPLTVEEMEKTIL